MPPVSPIRHLVVEADGASRRNPGPAAYGAIVRDAASGEVLAERSVAIGEASNNVAEYSGLVAGLAAAAEIDPSAHVEVRMDSELVVNQMSGRYKISHPDMRTLADAARAAFDPERVRYTWVPRAENAEADRLANAALDGRPHQAGAAATSIDAADVLPPTEDEPPSVDEGEVVPPAEVIVPRNRIVGWATDLGHTDDADPRCGTARPRKPSPASSAGPAGPTRPWHRRAKPRPERRQRWSPRAAMWWRWSARRCVDAWRQRRRPPTCSGSRWRSRTGSPRPPSASGTG